MSINHLSSSEGQWWSHYPAQTSSSSSSSHHPIISSSQQYSSNATFWVAAPMLSAFDLNNNEDDDESTDETPKERLFEKPLTPSDVGKLNRLVIPKQHAEKHFPLNAGAENGLLLGFEDEVGKSWRFRYSYWNSSQSYVLTKGWSRFVKEKRLDAGDVVVFARHRLDTGRFFIGWRRRQDPSAVGGWGRLFCSQSTGPSSPSTNSISISYHQHDAAAAPAPAPAAGGDGRGSSSSGQVSLSSSGSGNSKTVRLFGVNLHATDHDSEPSTPLPHQQYYYPSNHHMDISFSGGAADADADVYHRQG